MSDLLKLRTLLDEFGVEHKVMLHTGGTTVHIEAESRNVDGYSGFFTQFKFDESGKFISMGVWE